RSPVHTGRVADANGGGDCRDRRNGRAWRGSARRTHPRIRPMTDPGTPCRTAHVPSHNPGHKREPSLSSQVRVLQKVTAAAPVTFSAVPEVQSPYLGTAVCGPTGVEGGEFGILSFE